MDWHLLLLSFALIFPVELPDKTFVASLVLATRYRPLPVWVGIGTAFGVQCVVAVVAGRAVGFLPEWVIQIISTVMFLIGAFLLFWSARGADARQSEQEAEFSARSTADRASWQAAGASFLLIFAAEWGDLSQILTLNMVARYGSPLSIFLGSWIALLTVSGLAVLAGRVLLRHLRLSILHYVAGAVCLVFAGVGVYELVAGVGR